MKTNGSLMEKIVVSFCIALFAVALYSGCMFAMNLIGLRGFVEMLSVSAASLFAVFLGIWAILGSILVMKYFHEEIKIAKKA